MDSSWRCFRSFNSLCDSYWITGLLESNKADFIGFGEGKAIGYKQISGLLVGIIAIIAGVYLKQKKIGFYLGQD